MIWALPAAYLTKRPAWLQALVFGLCAGLFVTAAVESNNGHPGIGEVISLVLGIAVVVGGAFCLGLRAQVRRRPHGEGAPAWVHVAYVLAWLLAIVAALLALFGDGGFPVAVLAIVPIVLLAPPALVGIRALLGRQGPDASSTPPADRSVTGAAGLPDAVATRGRPPVPPSEVIHRSPGGPTLGA